MTGYWQNFNNGATVQKISDVPSAYDIIAVAFADATTTPGAVTFNLDSAWRRGYTVDQFKADVRAKQAAGKKVIISVGGEKGTVSVNSSASATNFASSVHPSCRSTASTASTSTWRTGSTRRTRPRPCAPCRRRPARP
ncbi:hypothetical protein STENM327S_05427 [Streptomyces tendae]